MSEKENMDKLIRDKFDGFSVEPPAHVWTNIQEQMAAKRRKARMIYMGWISAAAVVIFAFIAGWLVNNRADDVSQKLNDHQASVQQAPVTNKDLDKNTSVKKEEVSNGEADSETDVTTRRDETGLATVLVAENIQKEQAETDLSETFERISYRLMKSIRGYAKVDQKTGLSQMDIRTSGRNTVQTVDEISDADRRLMAANARDMKENVQAETGWVIGANVSPGYASHKASHSNQYARSLSSGSTEGAANLGGGLSVQYKTNERLRVETGVYYSKNGIKSGSGSGSSDRLYAADPSFDYASGQPERISGDQMFSSAVEVDQGNIVMNTTAGVVNITNTPTNATLALSNTLENDDYPSVLTTDGQFSQAFDFVEIPLYLRYNVLDKKFGIDIVGGFNAGLVVGNNAYIENNGDRQRIGSTEDISTLNISGTVGLGVNYALNKHISLAVEPRFNYYLNSINTNPDVVYKPYRLGLYTGVYYQF
ncbi:MAG: outer membrane beta-barrel protein [Draconibacterium sp.]